MKRLPHTSSGWRNTRCRRSCCPGRCPSLNVPLSVLDLAPVGRGSSPAEALRELDRSRARGRAPRLPAPLGGRAPQHARASRARRRRCCSRTSPPVDLDDPARLRRAHAPEPRAARGRRAVRDARSAAPRPHRPRDRPRARHRPGHRAGAAPDTGRSAPTTSPSSSASSSASSTARSRTATRTSASPRCPAAATARRSGCSARAPTARTPPGVLGMPFSFAYHFAPGDARCDALAAYRQRVPAVRRSWSIPYVMLGVSVVCGETDEHARWLAAPGALAFLRLRSGRPDVYPTPEEAAEYRFTPVRARASSKAWTSSHVVGGPDRRCGRELEALVERTGVDELMVTTMVHGHADRIASYRLLAREWLRAGHGSAARRSRLAPSRSAAVAAATLAG